MQFDAQPNVSAALERILTRKVDADRLTAAKITVEAPWARGHDTVHRVTVDGQVFDIPTVDVLNEIYDPQEVTG